MTTVPERLAGGRAAFSVEFFPPRDAADEHRLWQAVRAVEPADPAFVSVTYGAGGSSRDRTIAATAAITEHTGLCTVAHLAGVGHSREELRGVVGWYAATGVRNVLVVRGDPPGDPLGPWTPHPDGITHAVELVELVRSLGDFCVGVAAFPYGHPRSPDPDTDLRHLVAKVRAGADFAISQLFFEAETFLRLRDRLAARVDVPLLPGIMPLTTRRTLRKAVELSGLPGVLEHLRGLAAVDDPADFRAAGMDLIHELCARLLAEGVPALHFYSLNRSAATLQLVERLGLHPATTTR